jgi:small-conductance mechanosensitive channel/CRP-like cAMP-binding protein
VNWLLSPIIIADVLLLLLALGLQSATQNRFVRRRLQFSVVLLLTSLGLIAAFAAPSLRLMLADFAPVPGLLFAAALINTLVSALLNPLREDRISDRFPNIVQDALFVGFFFATATFIFRESWTASAVSAVVVGFAAQDTLGNAFAGLGIQIEKPFRVGHWIKVGEFEGRVEQVTWRATKIHTRVGTYVVLPNNVISKESITNYSEPILPMRIHVDVGATYLKTPDEVKAALLDAMAQSPLVLPSPAADVLVQEFANSAITYRARFWIAEFERDERARDQVRTAIYYSFRRRNIDIPYPIQVEYSNEVMPSASMAPEAIVEALRAVEIFTALDDEQVRELASGSREALYAGGETVVRQNEPGASMFVVHRGQVRVTLDPGGQEVARIEAGGFLGEMSLLTGDPRTATVSATRETLLIEIPAESFRRVALDHPTVLDTISTAVVARRAGLDKTRAEAAVEDGSLREQSNTLISRVRRFLHLPGA